MACGRTYEVKLCPRLHENSREAEVCSTCGSTDLSTPQPKLPLWFTPLLRSLALLPGIGLLILSISFLFSYIRMLVYHSASQFRYMLVGLGLAALWLLYIQLPSFVRRKLRRRARKP
jgi:hypothetical protein